MGTNSASLLANIFLFSYEAEFIVFAINWKEKLASQLNFTYRYIDEVLSINNPDFENYVTNFIINSKFEYNDVNMIVYNLYSKSINSKRNGASRRGTGKSCPTVRHGLRLYKEAAILTVSALLLWMLNCVDRCYNFVHYVIAFDVAISL